MLKEGWRSDEVLRGVRVEDVRGLMRMGWLWRRKSEEDGGRGRVFVGRSREEAEEHAETECVEERKRYNEGVGR